MRNRLYSICGSLLLVILVAVAIFLLYRFADTQFRLNNIKTSSITKPIQLSHEAEELLQTIFNQPFQYLDRGKQSYVFLSRDRRFVLKFFDMRCSWSGSFPLIKPINAKHCAKKYERLLAGYRLAWERDRLNTGLVYIQLEPNPLNPFQVTLYDRFGFQHTVPLANVPFVIQEYAVPTRVVVSTLLDRGDVAGAKAVFDKLRTMYLDEYRNGIVDGDHNLMYNTGFVGDRPVRIDAGRLHESHQTDYSHDLKKVFGDRVTGWLHRHYPGLEKL